ncbi:glycosyltransferase family 4 protein [Pedococcus sp. KACC 23699]|uniref:Glycosyltransferase family 4 protein n=1 Tax=Pedococcus sp. KACC 23699 TaxID=3149228 RepID=A0AAU7JSE6_9MICO
MRTVHVVVPDAVDDPSRPSGGNTYDRRVCAELPGHGWTVRVHALSGCWPRPDQERRDGLATVLAGMTDGSVVVLDGLVACGLPEAVVPQANRLHIVVLVHLPLGAAPGTGADGRTRRAEHAVLSKARAIVTTSEWTRRWLLAAYPLDPSCLHVAQPGADPAEPAHGTPTGGALLCVAAVVPAKGHDDLLRALTRVRDLPWRLTCAGAVDLDAPFHEGLVRQAAGSGIAGRVDFVGPRGADELARLYADADVLVLASRLETYGLVLTEALARGLPVVAASVGGVPEAVGRAPDGTRPGLLVPGGDVDAFADAIRAWLADAELRRRLRRAAGDRRSTLVPWSTTAHRIGELLGAVAP